MLHFFVGMRGSFSGVPKVPRSLLFVKGGVVVMFV
jgi:hypothetical protein